MSRLHRREMLQLAAAATVAATSGPLLADERVPMLKGRINHSLVHWCYKDQFADFPAFCAAAKQLGAKSIEVTPVEQWPTLKEYGLTCALAGSHTFVKGLNNPKYWDECLTLLRTRIEQSAAFGCPNVITFTGYREDIPDDVGAKNCVAALKQIAGFAEEKKVTLCLEMLNTRASDHPMKGHPGYQGDHTDYCVEILKQVGSPRVKLLFDVYHVQIMDGDVIRRIHQHKDWIAHIHTAGNPGRAEMDDTQEIHYPPIMRALLEIGYTGYVGHEFIPTRDVMGGLKEAIAWCDV